jgi:hypothetical protein
MSNLEQAQKALSEAGAAIESAGDRANNFLGKPNIYTCETCGGHIVTRDADAGVTPFMTGCKSTAGCKGYMRSSMYRVFDQNIAATHEWYRPDAKELADKSASVIEHVRQGGLLLRALRSQG